jgi:DNA-binding CsgD family transcriptional regulator/PAS domain-containing protein
VQNPRESEGWLTVLSAEDLGMPEVIRSIYDAALDASRWKDFLALFAAEFSSEAAMIFGQDFSNGSVDIGASPSSFAAYHGVGNDAMQAFAAHYCRCNVWTENEHLHHEGQVVNASRLYPDRYLPKTEWHGDWLRPLDLFYSFAAVVEKRAHRSFNVTAVRSKRRGAYTAAEENRLRALMPHLQTAFALHRRLHRAEALVHASLSVLDSLAMGVVLLDGSGAVLHVNPQARSLIQASSILELGAGDTFHAMSVKDDSWLQRAIRNAVTTGTGAPVYPGEARRLHGLNGSSVQLFVAPLPNWSSPFGVHTAGAVFITDPSTVHLSLEGALCSVYRLTVAEARLANALLNGQTLQEYAWHQGISIHTARSQYKSAAGKVGVGRQTDFVRTLLTGPALLRWGF